MAAEVDLQVTWEMQLPGEAESGPVAALHYLWQEAVLQRGGLVLGVPHRRRVGLQENLFLLAC